ncbi:MAG: 23S rRNA (uracil(1939)-C(5))-methyltransferase RlmD [bacterium]
MDSEKNTPLNLSPGQTIELTVDDVAYGGDSVGKYQNLTVFMSYGVPGDKLLVKITEVKKNYAVAQIKEVLEQSPERFKAICPYFTICGGCDWMNINYTEQKKRKLKILNYSLEKTAEIKDLKAEVIQGYENPLFYRDRAQYKIFNDGKVLRIGFYRADTHEVVDIEKCYIVNDKINRIMGEIRTFLKAQKNLSVYAEDTGEGFLRHIAIRVNTKGDALVTIVASDGNLIANEWVTDLKDKLKRMPDIKGIILNINKARGNKIFGDREALLYGEAYITENYKGIDFRLGSDTFFQVNTNMLSKMSEFIGKHLDRSEDKAVVDLYGGVGALSLPFYKKLKSIAVIEINRFSVEAVKKTALEYKMENVTAVVGDAEKAQATILKRYKPCTLIIDPPRKGMATSTIEAIKKSGIKNIIYISCNPSTFSRDIALLKDVYELKEVEALDLFPQTYHIEVLSRLELKLA